MSNFLLVFENWTKFVSRKSRALLEKVISQFQLVWEQLPICHHYKKNESDHHRADDCRISMIWDPPKNNFFQKTPLPCWTTSQKKWGVLATQWDASQSSSRLLLFDASCWQRGVVNLWFVRAPGALSALDAAAAAAAARLRARRRSAPARSLLMKPFHKQSALSEDLAHFHTAHHFLG